MNPILAVIMIPIVLGLICLFIPRRFRILYGILGIFGGAVSFGCAIWLFKHQPTDWLYHHSVLLIVDQLSGFILMATGLFGFLIALYSIQYMRSSNRERQYYSSYLFTLGGAFGAILSNHLILLLVFWGFIGLTFYLLILTGGNEAASAAKKSLMIIGSSDALMLLGIGFIYVLSNSFEIDKISLSLNSLLAVVAFLCLTSGSFAKAGAMPLHTWIPPVAEKAPIPVTAYLPAALDKLLGIYFLARITLYLFNMSKAANLFLMIIGAVTIVAAVMMALIQHDLRKLLAYHAVSQVGYMVLGIGTGNPIGIAGGLFHMLNHAIYKACLFLTGGAVQKQTGTTDLNRLGGLGKLMPLTFSCFFIAAVAISGLPPLNGFVSKWMVYQGLVELGKAGDKLWILWLITAMFGSGLTLASFMKLTHAIFLGLPAKGIASKRVKDVGFTMALPMVVLAILCVVFGVFAYPLPVKHFLLPLLPQLSYIGSWTPGLATVMVFLGLIVGVLIYIMGNLKGLREADSFIGGEESLPSEVRVTGNNFYETIKKLGPLGKAYEWADEAFFDVYQLCGRFALMLAGLFRKLHSGVLTLYMGWIVGGLVILLIIMMWR